MAPLGTMDCRYYGQVKWFKDHKGYGFISVMGRCDGEPADADAKEVFVHHTDLHPVTSTYKTLLKGEYVSFRLKHVSRARSNSPETVDTQASDVRGAFGGGLMCDGLNVSAITRGGDCTPLVLHNGDIMFGSGEDVIL